MIFITSAIREIRSKKLVLLASKFNIVTASTCINCIKMDLTTNKNENKKKPQYSQKDYYE